MLEPAASSAAYAGFVASACNNKAWRLIAATMACKCHVQDARGDQCDKCGRLLNPTELLNPKCKLTGTTPVLRSTRHIFLDLPALTPQLQAYIDSTSNKGGWSANCIQASGTCVVCGSTVCLNSTS